MSIQNSKKFMLSSLIGLGLMASATVKAQEVSLEEAMANALLAQTQTVVQELSMQLSESVAHEISQFSIESTTTWFSNENKANVKNTISSQVATSKDTSNNTSEDE